MVNSKNDWLGGGSKFHQPVQIISYDICNLNLRKQQCRQDIYSFVCAKRKDLLEQQLAFHIRQNVGAQRLLQAWPDQNFYPYNCSSLLKTTLESSCTESVLSYIYPQSHRLDMRHLNTLTELQLLPSCHAKWIAYLLLLDITKIDSQLYNLQGIVLLQ